MKEIAQGIVKTLIIATILGFISWMVTITYMVFTNSFKISVMLNIVESLNVLKGIQ